MEVLRGVCFRIATSILILSNHILEEIFLLRELFLDGWADQYIIYLLIGINRCTSLSLRIILRNQQLTILIIIAIIPIACILVLILILKQFYHSISSIGCVISRKTSHRIRFSLQMLFPCLPWWLNWLEIVTFAKLMNFDGVKRRNTSMILRTVPLTFKWIYFWHRKRGLTTVLL